MQDLNDKVTGNTLTAAEWDEVPSELQNVITALGQTLSGADFNQLGKAIAGYAANGTFYTDGGAADAYVLTAIGTGKQAPPSYIDGMLAAFLVTNTNTGASTVNVASLGVKDIKDKNGVALGAGALTAGQIAFLRYDSSNGWFVYEGAPGQDLAAQTLAFTFASDANDTLTAAENLFGRIAITGTTLTAGRTLTVANTPRLFIVDNGEGFAVTPKTSAGTGIEVPAGSSKLLMCDGTNVINPLPTIASLPLLHVQDQKTSGTSGGNSIVGVQTRTLNTVVTNEISGASLSSNQITLPAGTYELSAYAMAYAGVGSHRGLLYNVTDATYIIIGMSQKDDNSLDAVPAILRERFTLAATKVLELRHYTAIVQVGGLGFAVSDGNIEIYSDVQIRKVS